MTDGSLAYILSSPPDLWDLAEYFHSWSYQLKPERHWKKEVSEILSEWDSIAQADDWSIFRGFLISTNIRPPRNLRHILSGQIDIYWRNSRTNQWTEKQRIIKVLTLTQKVWRNAATAERHHSNAKLCHYIGSCKFATLCSCSPLMRSYYYMSWW